MQYDIQIMFIRSITYNIVLEHRYVV